MQQRKSVQQVPDIQGYMQPSQRCELQMAVWELWDGILQGSTV